MLIAVHYFHANLFHISAMLTRRHRQQTRRPEKASVPPKFYLPLLIMSAACPLLVVDPVTTKGILAGIAWPQKEVSDPFSISLFSPQVTVFSAAIDFLCLLGGVAVFVFLNNLLVSWWFLFSLFFWYLQHLFAMKLMIFFKGNFSIFSCTSFISFPHLSLTHTCAHKV